MGSPEFQVLQSERSATLNQAIDRIALAHEAEDAMAKTAHRLEAWARSLAQLTPEDMAALRGAFEREAQRLRSEGQRLVARALLDASTIGTVR